MIKGSKKDVPENWCIVTINDVYQIYGGGTPSTSKPEYWNGNIPWITSADIQDICTINVRKYVTEKGIEKSTTTKAPANSLLVVTRVGLGKIAIIKEDTCFSQDLQALVMSANFLIPEYTLYLLSYKLQFLKYEGRGTTISGITKKQLKDLEYPLSPLNEQLRIVSKIEELFSELDKGIESLKIAHEQLKVYRQALLKHAFEGKLTEQWRKENADKLETADQLLERIKLEREARYQQQLEEWKAAVKKWEKNGKKPSKPKPVSQINLLDQSKYPKLPSGWLWFSVSQLCEVVRGGSPRPAGDEKYYNGNIPFLKVADITRNPGAYLNTYSYTIKESGLTKTRFVKPPVLMLSNSGATLGVPKICQIETTFNDGIAAFLGLPINSLLYHYYFWESKTSELRDINQGAAQPNLNTDLIQEYILPVCSAAEMGEISKKIEQNLSICLKIEEEILLQLKLAESLRQSILKKAFSGQLVLQDPNDEPASVLLDRIAREKANAAAMVKKSRSLKKTQKDDGI